MIWHQNYPVTEALNKIRIAIKNQWTIYFHFTLKMLQCILYQASRMKIWYYKAPIASWQNVSVIKAASFFNTDTDFTRENKLAFFHSKRCHLATGGAELHFSSSPA